MTSEPTAKAQKSDAVCSGGGQVPRQGETDHTGWWTVRRANDVRSSRNLANPKTILGKACGRLHRRWTFFGGKQETSSRLQKHS